MQTDREIKIKEIKIYFKERYGDLIDNMGNNDIAFLWELLNGRSGMGSDESK
jgi:hypothetical protein|tara:strand:- start:1646 stop:1801 length:156 start_codon:yes stop_codon:yes gene_type:complete